MKKFGFKKPKQTPLKKAFGTQKVPGMAKEPKMPAAPPFGRVKQPRGTFGGPTF